MIRKLAILSWLFLGVILGLSAGFLGQTTLAFFIGMALIPASILAMTLLSMR